MAASWTVGMNTQEPAGRLDMIAECMVYHFKQDCCIQHSEQAGVDPNENFPCQVRRERNAVLDNRNSRWRESKSATLCICAGGAVQGRDCGVLFDQDHCHVPVQDPT